MCRSGNHFSRISGGGLEYILTKSLRGILSSQGPPGASLSPKGQVLLCTRHASFLVQPALLSTASPSAALWGPLALQRHPPVQFCSEAQTSMPLPPFMFWCRVPLPRNPFLPCFELENLTQPCPFGNKDTGSKGEDVNIHRIPSLSPEPSSSTPLLSRASVTARAGVLVPGPALLLTLAPITPEHDSQAPTPGTTIPVGPSGTWNLYYQKQSWQFCRALGYGARLANSHQLHSAALSPSIQDQVSHHTAGNHRGSLREGRGPLPPWMQASQPRPDPRGQPHVCCG